MKRSKLKRNHLPLLLLLACLLTLTLALAACHNGPGTGEESRTDTSAGSENASGTQPDGPGTSPADTDPTDPGTDPGGDPTRAPDETGAEPTQVEPVTLVDPETDPVTPDTDEETEEEEESLEPIEPWDPWAPEEPATSADSGEETAAPVDPTNPDHPGDASAYQGVMIAAVYGTGKKNTDASIANGYVQLYNAADKALSLSGLSLYYKTDGAKPYAQLAFPADAKIPAHGYYLVRANAPEGYDESAAIMSVDYYDLAWDIWIDNKEVRLVLAPSQWLIDTEADITTFTDAVSVFYASETPHPSIYATSKLSKDRVAVRTALTDYSGYHTVKLSESATGELNKLRTITSDGTVNTYVSSRLDEVKFSHDAGIYDKGISLSMTAASGRTIYYTLDGSDPTKSSTRKVYTGSIKLSDTSAIGWGPTIKAWSNGASASTMPGGYVIKAYATGTDGDTPVYTNTYFIAPGLKDYNISLISLSIPVAEAFGSKGFYNHYNTSGYITDTRPRGLAMMEVFDENGLRRGHSNVELAVSGNGSSGAAQKSLRIYYKGADNEGGGLESDLDYDLFKGLCKDEDGQVITSFSRLLIRNSGNDCGDSYVRDAYMQRVSDILKVDTMASASALVFINGEFWGVYNVRERYSGEYVESHYGVDKDNVALLESDYAGLVYRGDACADFIVSSGIEGDEKDFNDLYHFIRDNELTNEENYLYVCRRMDIDSFIDMFASRTFFCARDWPENNIKVWRDRTADPETDPNGRWHFTLLDMDMGLAFYDFTREGEQFLRDYVYWNGSTMGIFFRKLLTNEDFKTRFILRYYELCNDLFTPEYLSAEWEKMVTERDPLAQLQHNRWSYNVGMWSNAKERIRSFINNRSAIALQHMLDFFGITEQDLNVISAKRISFSYNNARSTVLLNDRAVEDGQVFRFERDKVRFTVKAEALEGFYITSIVWDGVDGTTIKKDVNKGSGKATFTVEGTGVVTVYTKRVQTEGEPVGGTLVAGATYMFYLDPHGDLYAWGDNRKGILGLNSDAGNVPTPKLVMTNVAKVSTTTSADYENGSTNWMTAILTKDGKLYTVGSNGNGQLGRNEKNDDYKLGLVKFNGEIADVSVGYDHMVIIDANGVLWGVGNNSYGQLGKKAGGGSTTTFARIASGVKTAAAGRRQTMWINENGDLYGLGDNRWNKMVAGGAEKLTTAAKLLSNAESVVCGEHECLAITEDGTLYYAGWRTLHGFGQGGGNNPALAKVMTGVTSASIYFGDMTVVTDNNEAYVYGLNTGNSIGHTVTDGTPVKFASEVIAAAAGYNFTAYLYDDGTIRVQGTNDYGQAGSGKTGGQVSLQEVDI